MSLAINGVSQLKTGAIIKLNNNFTLNTNKATISKQPNIASSFKPSHKIISEKKLSQSNQKDVFQNNKNPFGQSNHRKNSHSPQFKRVRTAKSTGRYEKKSQITIQEQNHNLKQIINMCEKKLLSTTKKPIFQKNKTEEYQSTARRSLMVSANRNNRQKIHTLNTPLAKSCKLNKNQLFPQNLRVSTTTSKEIKNESTARRTSRTSFLTCKKLKSQNKQIYYNQCLSSLLIQRQINLRLNNQFEQERFQTLINKLKGKQQPLQNFQDDNDQEFIVFNKFEKSIQTSTRKQPLLKNGQSSPIFSKCMINPQNQFSQSFSQYRQKAKNSIFKSALQWSNKRINVMKTSRQKTRKQCLKDKKQEFQMDIDRWEGSNDIQPIPLQKFQK